MHRVKNFENNVPINCLITCSFHGAGKAQSYSITCFYEYRDGVLHVHTHSQHKTDTSYILEKEGILLKTSLTKPYLISDHYTSVVYVPREIQISESSWNV